MKRGQEGGFWLLQLNTRGSKGQLRISFCVREDSEMGCHVWPWSSCPWEDKAGDHVTALEVDLASGRKGQTLQVLWLHASMILWHLAIRSGTQSSLLYFRFVFRFGVVCFASIMTPICSHRCFKSPLSPSNMLPQPGTVCMSIKLVKISCYRKTAQRALWQGKRHSLNAGAWKSSPGCPASEATSGSDYIGGSKAAPAGKTQASAARCHLSLTS